MRVRLKTEQKGQMFMFVIFFIFQERKLNPSEPDTRKKVVFRENERDMRERKQPTTRSVYTKEERSPVYISYRWRS